MHFLSKIISRPPLLYRLCFPGALWRLPSRDGNRRVYLTFDDGPIPEVTPWVLEELRKRDIKATFFCVADNVRKHPETFVQLKKEGHDVGNHTYHHLQGLRTRTRNYIKDCLEASELIGSKLFRPPYGHIRIRQYLKLRKHYKIVMWDLVTRDYSKHVSPQETLDNLKRYVRDGSIIVFHDSLKAERNLRYALPRALDYLKAQGYEFRLLSQPY